MSDATKAPLLGRMMRTLLTTAVTLAVVGGAGLAVFYGSATLADRAAAGAVAEIADPTPVEVVELALEDGYDLTRRFVGQVEAGASVVLSFELGGRLSELLVEEGESVSEGQTIARLDTALLEADRNRLEASLAATSAQLQFAESRLARAQSLREEGFSSQETVDQALATRDELANRIREIEAAIEAVTINIAKSELIAPFDGRVGQQAVDGGETLAAGAPVLTLIETAAPQVRVGLPLSIDVAALDGAEVEIGGRSFPARLIQVRPDIDPVTRTRTALFRIDADALPTFGETATLSVPTRVDVAGTWVPLDALQEGLGGTWTVLTVDDGIVRVASVEILHSSATRAYVQGTFQPGAQMIRTGAHRVVPGQRVRVLAAGD